jgi:hypothetical protein
MFVKIAFFKKNRICLSSVPKMQFYNELLEFNWYISSQGEMPSKGSNTLDEAARY